MEILIYLILGSILGVSVGNTNIRNKIAEEIRTIITQEHTEKSNVVKDCPIKKSYKAEWAPSKPQPKQQTKEQTGGCNKCGGQVEPIDKMPGYYFCTACNSITSKKKDNATKS
jgi:hypothetical protein